MITVNLPIMVPYGYCWGNSSREVCKYFNVKQWRMSCKLFDRSLALDSQGSVVKTEKCKNLKEVK